MLDNYLDQAIGQAVQSQLGGGGGGGFDGRRLISICNFVQESLTSCGNRPPKRYLSKTIRVIK